MPYILPYILIILIFSLAYFIILCGRYFARRKRTGEILIKIRGSSMMLREFKVGACIMILVLLYSFWNWRQIPAVLIPYFFHSPSFEFLCFLLFFHFVFLCLPIKVCEYGIVDHNGFIPWDRIEGYERNNGTRVSLRLKQRRLTLGKHIVRLNQNRAEGGTLSITHPPEQKDQLDAILSKHFVMQKEI